MWKVRCLVMWSEEWNRPGKSTHLESTAAPNKSEVKTSRWAIASLVCAVVGMAPTMVFALPSLPAIVMGFEARRRIRRSGGMQTGNRLANIGIVVGALCLLGPVIAICTWGY
jgi:Domain of unknown function (DUF4190)